MSGSRGWGVRAVASRLASLFLQTTPNKPDSVGIGLCTSRWLVVERRGAISVARSLSSPAGSATNGIMGKSKIEHE
jgi:hypothetical protein